MNTSVRILLLVSIVCCPSLAAAAASGTLRTVALSGQPAPGAPGMAGFGFFSNAPALNAAGQSAFLAPLQIGGDVNNDNNTGMWSEGSGALALVAREGSQAPGTPAGTLFSNLESPLLNAAGQTAFNASLRGPGVTNRNGVGVWMEINGPLELLARMLSQAPGPPAGANFFSLGTVKLANEHALFSAGLLSGGGGVTVDDNSGIWRVDGGALNLVVREGSQAPGAPTGAMFSEFNGVETVLSASGKTAFRGTLRGAVAGVTADNDVGIWSEAGGALGLVAREGSQAPGAPTGVNFRDFGGGVFANPSIGVPGINGAGQVAFYATLVSAGAVNGSNDTGVWSQGGGALALVAREGDPAPGTPAGVVFGNFVQPAVINAVGDSAFVGALRLGLGGVDATNDAGIWAEDGGALQLVIREGSQAPGTPSGVKFDFTTPRTPASIVLNSAGQMAFLASLQFGSGGVTSANDRGIWAEDITGVLRLITREGDALEVAPGDFRTVSGLSFRGDSGNEDGRGSGFNDLGQVAFVATFTNGTSGVFVSNLATLPEPTSLALVVVAAMLGAAKIRQRW